MTHTTLYQKAGTLTNLESVQLYKEVQRKWTPFPPAEKKGNIIFESLFCWN